MNSVLKTPSVDISDLKSIEGFVGACLVDIDSGMMLASVGGDDLELDVAGALNTDVLRSKRAAIGMLNLDDHIEDILITLGKQYHLIRPLENNPTYFLYVVLNKKAANLGMSRLKTKAVEATIFI